MVEQDNLLSAEELQALSAGLEDGSLEVGSGLNTSLRVMKHDLTSEDTSLGVNVSSIDMINERFIRQLRVGLVEVLRTTPKVQVAEIKTMRFHEYVSPLKSPLSVNTIRINPLRGFSLVVIDTAVIFSCLDNFFGLGVSLLFLLSFLDVFLVVCFYTGCSFAASAFHCNGF